MGKIAVFLFDNMTDYEVTFLTHLLKVDAGREVITLSYEDKMIRSASGVMYRADTRVQDVSDGEIDGLILCGGWFGELRSELTALIQKLNTAHKLLAGICGAGTYFLAASGVLKNVRYTTPITQWTEKHREVFGNVDPFPRENYVQSRVVTDKNIITAQGIAFLDFAVAVCDWLGLFASEDEKNCFIKLYCPEA